MSVSRRKFVKAGATAATFAAMPLKSLAAGGQQEAAEQAGPVTFAQVPYRSRLDRTFYVNKSSFSPHLNTPFRVRAGVARTVTLTLVEVRESKMAARAKGDAQAGEKAFSLLFEGGRGEAVPQGVYTVEHAALGELSLLVVPVNRADGRKFFAESIINHLLP